MEVSQIESQKICKKCLLRDIKGKDYEEIIAKALSDIKDEDKAPKLTYEERLNLCKECDRLSSGTCLSCGCYVEIRAYLVNGRCPKRKWQK